MSKQRLSKPAITMLVLLFLSSSLFSILLSPSIVRASDGTSEYEGAPGARAVFGGLGGTELFLGGNYIELGISNWGDFGTEGLKPDNFRGTLGGEITPDRGSNLIGMSADHDGFNRGRDLPVDYYLPGTPEERFVVGYKVGENTFANSNSALEFSKNMPTTVSNDSDVSNGLLMATIVSTWADTMKITQVVSFKVNEKFYRTHVTLENISNQTWDGARYMRSFDPDNSQYRGGDYVTANTVTHTIAEDGKAVVKAETVDEWFIDPMYEATGSRIPFFFYSTDPAAKTSLYGFTNTNPYVNLGFYYEGADAYDNPRAKGETIVDDIAITITWDSGEMAPGESKSFIFYSSLDDRDFEEVEQDIESRHIVTFGVAEGDGSISASINDTSITSGQEAAKGSAILFTADPGPGSQIKDWFLNGTSLGETAMSYTIADLQADTDIRVAFETTPEETTAETTEETTAEATEETTAEETEETTAEATEETTAEATEETTAETTEETTAEATEETTAEETEETTLLIIPDETIPLAETHATTETAKKTHTETTTQDTLELTNEEIPQTGQTGNSVVIGSVMLALAGSLVYILSRKKSLN